MRNFAAMLLLVAMPMIVALAGCSDDEPAKSDGCVGSNCADVPTDTGDGDGESDADAPNLGDMSQDLDTGVPDTADTDTVTPDQIPDMPPGNAPVLQGYGSDSTFGGGPGAETCQVTTLDDAGPGSLRDCIENREGPAANPTPRTVTFAVSGTIVLLSDLPIRQPFLTIDGLSAPAPGITIAKQGNGEDGEVNIQTWRGNNTCGHDVLVQGIRFQGVWTRDTTDHSQNAGLLNIDGEDVRGCLHHVAVFRCVYVDGQDGAGTIWGSVTDLTFAYNLVLYNYHPQSISHFPGGDFGQERERLSIHHNVYAYSTERIPNVRGNVWDTNIEQNIMHQWAAAGLGSSYATQFRCRAGGCPQRINLMENHYTSASPAPAGALEFNDNADPAEVYSAGNRFPPEEGDDGTAPSEFPRASEGVVTLFEDSALASAMLPWVGLPNRTAEEQAVLEEIAGRVTMETP